MKRFNCRLVQCWNGSNDDVLECMTSGAVIPLKTGGEILVVDTVVSRYNVYEDICKIILEGTMSALFPIDPRVKGVRLQSLFTLVNMLLR